MEILDGIKSIRALCCRHVATASIHVRLKSSPCALSGRSAVLLTLQRTCNSWDFHALRTIPVSARTCAGKRGPPTTAEMHGGYSRIVGLTESVSYKACIAVTAK